MCTSEDWQQGEHVGCGLIASKALELLDLENQIHPAQVRIDHYPENGRYVLMVVETAIHIITYGINLNAKDSRPVHVQELKVRPNENTLNPN
jgi:hypothetical protein